MSDKGSTISLNLNRMGKRVSKTKLINNVTKLLRRNGFNTDEIKATIRSWDYAALSEKYSHGYDRITWLLKMVKQNKIIPNRPIKITKRGIFTHIEGNNSLGYLAAEKAVYNVIIAAKQFGVGSATIADCYPTGCMGQYTEKITQSDQIGITVSHSSPRVAAFGTIDKIFGTMGHSFGFPSKKIPYIYNASIGAITNGTIMNHYSTNTLFPKNSVFTKKGVMTINPSDVLDEKGIFNGIIAIAGDRHANKISGLAGSLELLTRLALISIQKQTDAYSFFMAINPSFFGDQNTYRKMVDKLQKEIVGGKKQKDIKKVYFAGQKSYLLRKKNSTKKTILVSSNTYKFLFSKNEGTV